MVSAGQTADLKWNPTGTALLAHCMTEVDDSGKSYYGGSKLLLISYDGHCQKDLTEPDEFASGGVCQALLEGSFPEVVGGGSAEPWGQLRA